MTEGSPVARGLPSEVVSSGVADDRGLRIPAEHQGVLDVLFDGRRVWSLLTERFDVLADGMRDIRWPPVLEKFLEGSTHVTVVEHGTDRVLLDEQASFGTGRGAVEVADAQGRPLAVTKYGRLNHPFDSVGREALEAYLDQVEEVLDVLQNECGLPAFVTWGTLLGAVRTGRVIGHDVDADLGYLSSYEHPADMARESYRVERALRGRGWTVRRENAGFLALFFKQADGTTRNLDVFATWVTDGWLYQIHDIRAQLPRSTIVPLTEVELEGRMLPAPADPPALLEAAYGPSWRVPDPSFKFRSPRSTRRRMFGWCGGLRNRRDYWSSFYGGAESKRVPDDPSTFAAWVAERDDAATTLVDLGCGNGRDSLWFARSGRAVVGVDFAPPAVREASRRAKRSGLDAGFEVFNLYDLRHALVLGARLAHAGPCSLYARFLPHAVEHDARHNLWRVAEMALARGGRMFLEFRVEGGAPTEYAFGEHWRNPLRPDAVVEELARHGGRVVERVEGRGLAPFEGEDPLICRLVVEWSR